MRVREKREGNTHHWDGDSEPKKNSRQKPLHRDGSVEVTLEKELRVRWRVRWRVRQIRENGSGKRISEQMKGGIDRIESNERCGDDSGAGESVQGNPVGHRTVHVPTQMLQSAREVPKEKGWKNRKMFRE